jgi:pimeloyl-ACP methyl ester carboxylesterase
MQIEVVTRQAEGEAKARPLLFVHGILHGAWCWDEYFLPYFAEQGYHASALSLRNHAGSEKVSGWRWLRIQDYVADVAQVAAQIEAETGTRPVVIGHSMGGLIVQKYLEKYSAPAGILMASCPVHGVWQTLFRVMFNHPIAFLNINLGLHLKPVADTVERGRWSFFSESMPDEQVQQYLDNFDDESYFAFLDMLLFALPRPKRVSAPILVVAGADDTLFSVAEEEKTARAYNAEFSSFEGVAHDMMLEKDWQSSAEYIAKWLDKTLS